MNTAPGCRIVVLRPVTDIKPTYHVLPCGPAKLQCKPGCLLQLVRIRCAREGAARQPSGPHATRPNRSSGTVGTASHSTTPSPSGHLCPPSRAKTRKMGNAALQKADSCLMAKSTLLRAEVRMTWSPYFHSWVARHLCDPSPLKGAQSPLPDGPFLRFLLVVGVLELAGMRNRACAES